MPDLLEDLSREAGFRSLLADFTARHRRRRTPEVVFGRNPAGTIGGGLAKSAGIRNLTRFEELLPLSPEDALKALVLACALDGLIVVEACATDGGITLTATIPPTWAAYEGVLSADLVPMTGGTRLDAQIAFPALFAWGAGGRRRDAIRGGLRAAVAALKGRDTA